ncbi:MAG: peptide chain release factor N(5)-glutamine methyltransferase [Vicinamibacterales bacterium]
MSSIHDLVSGARQRLRAAGIDPTEADLDARLLAQHLLGWDAARYFADASRQAGDDFQAGFAVIVGRRAAREPMAYITGSQEFWGLRFEVGPSVLIPRPETELIVEVCLERWPRDAARRVVDVCTGSGCVAVALAAERPAARLVASDVSFDALVVARRNAVRHGAAGRIAFVQADLLAGIPGPFDLIVSNPPYVPMVEAATLPPEVVEHEPGLALFGGSDGLRFIRALVAQASERLAPEGTLIFELGFGQHESVSRILAASGFTAVEFRRDLQGIPRTAVASRTAPRTPDRGASPQAG